MQNPLSFSYEWSIEFSKLFFSRLHRYQLKDSLHRHLRHACRSNAAGHIAFDCYVCEKRFRYRFLVSDHIRKVHRIAPIRSKIKSCSTFRWTQTRWHIFRKKQPFSFFCCTLYLSYSIFFLYLVDRKRTIFWIKKIRGKYETTFHVRPIFRSNDTLNLSISLY